MCQVYTFLLKNYSYLWVYNRKYVKFTYFYLENTRIGPFITLYIYIVVTIIVYPAQTQLKINLKQSLTKNPNRPPRTDC